MKIAHLPESSTKFLAVFMYLQYFIHYIQSQAIAVMHLEICGGGEGSTEQVFSDICNKERRGAADIYIECGNVHMLHFAC